MNYEFDTLEALIASTQPLLLTTMPEAELAARQKEWLETANQESLRICSQFHQVYYQSTHADLLTRYFQHQQKTASYLSNKIRSLAADPAIQDRPDLSTFYQQFSESFERIIDYLLRHFEDYFNFESDIPYSYSLSIRSQLTDWVENLYEHFSRLPELNSLLDVIVLPIRPFLDNTHVTINYRLYFYYQHLIQVLLQLKANDEKQANNDIHVVCTHLNFNYSQYITFSIERLKFKMKNESMEEQLAKLRWYIKSITQVEKTHGLHISTAITSSAVARLQALGKLAPEPDSPSTPDQMRAWIKLEAEYFEYVHTMEQNTAGANKIPFKIATGLTVWKLAIFTEAFIKNKIFVPNSQTSYNQTLKGVAAIVYTPGAEELSFDSLRTKASTLRNIKNQKSVPLKVTQSLEECADHFLACYNSCRQWLKDIKVT